MSRELFGTDGIRGKANVYPMTGDIAFKLGRAVSYYFMNKKGGEKKRVSSGPLIIIGKDTRRSCYMLEQAISAGVCAQGGEAILTGPLPTPGIAFVTESMRADVGIMISASHNSFADNGIKIFSYDGYKLSDEIELEIESLILNPEQMDIKYGKSFGNAKRLRGVFSRYIVHTKATLNRKKDLEGVRVVLDCANGAAYKVTPIMYRELGLEVFPIAVEPNGININDECGSLYPSRAQDAVEEHRADLGICLDGDADRISVIDENGELINGDQIIGILAKYFLDIGALKKSDSIVGTVMSNIGLEKYLISLGLKFKRTQVGDRYIVEEMKESNAFIGGEPSGHIILLGHSTTGDGSLVGLKLIECMQHYQKTVSELAKEVKLYPQVLKNIPISEKKDLSSESEIQKVLESCKNTLKDKGRFLLRYSGTELKLRVMVEGNNSKIIQECCDKIVKVVQQKIGN